MKTLIFQVAVGDVKPFYEACMQSVEGYAERIGADYKVLREPILKIVPLNNQRRSMPLGFLPIFEKENAFNHLDEYDKICIVDADIYIRDSAPNIFDEIDMDIAFAGVIEAEMPLTSAYRDKVEKFSRAQYEKLQDVMTEWTFEKGHPFFNMGLMLFTSKLKEYLNGDTPEQFIRRKEFEKFVNGEGHHKWSTDQTLLNYWVKKTGMPVKHLDWRWNALFKAVKDDKLSDSYFIHFILADNLPKKGAEIPNIIKDLNLARSVKGHG